MLKPRMPTTNNKPHVLKWSEIVSWHSLLQIALSRSRLHMDLMVAPPPRVVKGFPTSSSIVITIIMSMKLLLLKNLV